ncbi:Helix-loop-helix protein delilah [Halotydeus destructor]|nr:Helix-loop-helix protein delilah [Halotydeus destructor]
MQVASMFEDDEVTTTDSGHSGRKSSSVSSSSSSSSSSSISSPMSTSDFDEPCDKSPKVPGAEKYNLRTKSIQNRLEVEKKRKCPAKKQAKPKQRPAPLSKYRRKTANLRERSRMQELNDGFERLRQAVPAWPTEEAQSPASDKLTKITTLRLAVNYIAILSNMLNDDNDDYESSASPSSFSSS